MRRRSGARFRERVFTAAEIAYAESKANRAERYAARFAAKEAGMKALGTGWRERLELARSGSGESGIRSSDAAAAPEGGRDRGGFGGSQHFFVADAHLTASDGGGDFGVIIEGPCVSGTFSGAECCCWPCC